MDGLLLGIAIALVLVSGLSIGNGAFAISCVDQGTADYKKNNEDGKKVIIAILVFNCLSFISGIIGAVNAFKGGALPPAAMQQIGQMGYGY